jgi:hypothetical protein
MSRLLTIAAAQKGPVQLTNPNDDVSKRLIDILREAAGHHVPEAYARITRLRDVILPPEESR